MPVVNSLTISPYTALYTSLVVDGIISVGTSTAQGRDEIVLDFNNGTGLFARDFETAFSWPISSGTILYTWQPSFLELPEDTYNRATDWIDIGEGNGLVQGIIIEAGSPAGSKVFQLQDSDTLSHHTLNEVGAGVSFNLQSIKAFSCAAPFVAHSIRVVSTDGVPWRVWRATPVFVPYPEIASRWQTEITSLNGVGWQYFYYLNVEYVSTLTIVVVFTVDSGNGSIAPASFTLPSTGGTQTKTKVLLTYNKWKLLGVTATSDSPFYLFVEGMEGYVKNWGSPAAFRNEKLFGGPSAGGATV